MIDFAFTEIFFIAVFALIILGPTQLIAVMRTLGGWCARLRFQSDLYREYINYQMTPTQKMLPKINKLYDPHVALYQPEIAQNTGTLARTSACLGLTLDIIEPCGFIWNDQKMRRAGMDYVDQASICKHESYEAFQQHYVGRRIILVDTKGEGNFYEFHFEPSDIVLLGRESDGVPDDLFQNTVHRLKIPMKQGRSLNVAVAGAMVVSEFLRQIRIHDDTSAKTDPHQLV